VWNDKKDSMGNVFGFPNSTLSNGRWKLGRWPPLKSNQQLRRPIIGALHTTAYNQLTPRGFITPPRTKLTGKDDRPFWTRFTTVQRDPSVAKWIVA
jgi:hypothetical protein